MPFYNPTGCPNRDMGATWPSRMGPSWAVSCKGRQEGRLGSGGPPTLHQPALLPVPHCPQQSPLTNCILSMNLKETLPGCCIWVSAWKDKAGCHPTSPGTALGLSSLRYAVLWAQRGA